MIGKVNDIFSIIIKIVFTLYTLWDYTLRIADEGVLIYHKHWKDLLNSPISPEYLLYKTRLYVYTYPFINGRDLGKLISKN